MGADLARRTVDGLLWAATESNPAQEFIVETAGRHSYASIAQTAARLSAHLTAWGVHKGERVALLADNSQVYVAAFYGIVASGAVVVPLNTVADGPWLAQVLRDCGARVLIVGPRLSRRFGRFAPYVASVKLLISFVTEEPEGCPQLARCSWTEATSNVASLVESTHGLDDVACIIYTSGSTGAAKGATLSHGNIVANTEAILAYLRLEPADRVLAVLPFVYVYGLSVLNTHAAAGATVVIENRFRYPNTALDTLEAERCTGFSGVPSSFALLLNHSNVQARELATLRYVTQAGGAMSPALTARLVQALPRQEVFIMYGATEASARLSYVSLREFPEAIGSIGRPIAGVELSVLTAKGKLAQIGEVGEIVARGPNVMRGYWNDPQETARVLDEHGYHTGDLGYLDPHGFFRLVGRAKEMIKSGGHRIAPKEIEDALGEHPAIDEVAVIGVADALLEQQIKAVVVLRPDVNVDAEQLRRFLRTRLPKYKIPQVFVFAARLPKTPAGKIAKRALV